LGDDHLRAGERGEADAMPASNRPKRVRAEPARIATPEAAATAGSASSNAIRRVHDGSSGSHLALSLCLYRRGVRRKTKALIATAALALGLAAGFVVFLERVSVTGPPPS
jgi:hypothetical protein